MARIFPHLSAAQVKPLKQCAGNLLDLLGRLGNSGRNGGNAVSPEHDRKRAWSVSAVAAARFGTDPAFGSGPVAIQGVLTIAIYFAVTTVVIST
jgi:hypothetical protein